MKKLLFVGDSPAMQSGFGRAAREILDVLRHSFDVTVLGINARGDPHDLPYPIYVAAVGGDAFGVGRLKPMCDLIQPDLIFIQNDGWNIPMYLKQLKGTVHEKTPVVASVAVDGENFHAPWLDGVTLASFWTEFGLQEARQAGYTGPGTVIELGVDLATYRPGDRREARLRRLEEGFLDQFIVGNVNRNQPRKRLDLTVKYFAEWVTAKQIKDAWLYLHIAPTGDTGIDARQLARYYGVQERILLMQPEVYKGISEDEMRDTYHCFDVQVSTTQGEGFGLTTLEGMACGIPQIVPDWAALGELCKDAAWLVPCPTTAVGPPYVNVLGGVPDGNNFKMALNRMYTDQAAREENSRCGLLRAQEERFRWANVGQAWADVLHYVLETPEDAWRDLGRPQEVSA